MPNLTEKSNSSPTLSLLMFAVIPGTYFKFALLKITDIYPAEGKTYSLVLFSSFELTIVS